tara:strand:+ start:1144 stop:1281 length:138 start_codon:yes stop_codon:yes gene_type:complete
MLALLDFDSLTIALRKQTFNWRDCALPFGDDPDGMDDAGDVTQKG